MIKSKKDWVKTLSVLRPEDAEDLKFCVQQLNTLIEDGVVSENTVKTLHNVTTMLGSVRESHITFMVTWLKQGYMED
jgi:hypothetical protein|tara:strand:+ start:34279 stop:34509 length:231 start_codon:yes stop_codon:yes gene_type:complete